MCHRSGRQLCPQFKAWSGGPVTRRTNRVLKSFFLERVRAVIFHNAFPPSLDLQHSDRGIFLIPSETRQKCEGSSCKLGWAAGRGNGGSGRGRRLGARRGTCTAGRRGPGDGDPALPLSTHVSRSRGSGSDARSGAGVNAMRMSDALNAFHIQRYEGTLGLILTLQCRTSPRNGIRL